MTPVQEEAVICRMEQLTADIFRLTAAAPLIAKTVRPGQFVMVKVGADLDPLLRRPFSVHLATGRGEIQLLFKVVGKGTGKLAALKAGHRLDMIGPLGQGFLVADSDQVCIIGGGLGIAPLFFLADHLRRLKRPATITILLGARTWAELAVLVAGFEKRGYAVQVATDDGSRGHHGSVVDLLAGLEHPGLGVYTCGPYPMMRAVARTCAQRGWDCQVSLETMMACGLAACLGCAVPRADGPGYLHACKDGPVVAARKLKWR